MHIRCSGIRGKLKEITSLNARHFANQYIDITEDCPDLELKGQFLTTVEKFCYLCDTIQEDDQEQHGMGQSEII